MTEEEFNRLFPSGEQEQPATPSAQQPAQTQEQDLEFDPQATAELLGSLVEQPEGGPTQPSTRAASGITPEQIQRARSSGVLGAISDAISPPDAVDAFTSGGMRAVFETKDFLFGDTLPEEQSSVRRGIELQNDQLKEEAPIINGLSSGIGQFAVAMIGIGKLGKVAQAIPKVGEALTAGKTAVEGVKGGAVALESGKAALAGAIAFDPHEARLSNLLQDTPLANPITAWLAADPTDSAAWGRVKSAMESIGLDAAIIGSLKLGGTVWKKLKAGDTAGASRTITDFERKLTAEPEAGIEVDEVNGESVPVKAPEGQPEAQQGAVTAETAPEPLPVKPSIEFSAEDMVGNPARPGFQDVARPGLLDDVDVHLENAEKDWDAVRTYGDTGKALASGKQFRDMGALWSRFRTDTDVQQYMELAVAHKAEKLEADGFKVRLTDRELQKQVEGFAELAGEDPAQLYGLLQSAGEAARTLTAKMQVAGSLSAKAFTDASLMALRRRLGDFSEFGSLAEMEAEIARRFQLATEFLKITDDIRAQGGRTVRANRGKPFDPSLFEGISRERFYDLLAESAGSPTQLKRLADPGLYRKLMDTVNYMRISSLVSGPKTQLINVLSNGYMVAARPMERIIGSIPGAVTGNQASRMLLKENLRQYTYMTSSFTDGFSQAVRAFTRNDGLLTPHNSSELRGDVSTAWQVPGTQAFGKGYFRPFDSFGNIFYNAISIPLSAAGAGPRVLGTVDELVKQTVYRSKVAARAHMEGVEHAVEQGLSGKAYKEYIKRHVEKRLDDAFDAEGRGLDAEALREANIATFQQELMPGTLGKAVQGFVSNESSQFTRLVLPFVKTPTNVIRYAWKLTPALNLLQGEYRQMFSGAMGHEAKAQAVGQMAMGTLFMGAAGALAFSGMITGGGPSNPRLKQQLLATGWQPYSIVTENEDGTKTYTPFNRYDPIALPFGIIADIQDALHVAQQSGDEELEDNIQTAMTGLAIGLAKQFTSRSYLLSLNQALEALSDPERSGKVFVGGVAQSMVPFSAATRQLSQDSYMRDARTVTDKMLQVVPGMSETLPPKFNWLGQLILNRQGLWSDDNGTLVDIETVRLGLEGSSVMGPPSYTMGFKGSEVDLRDITLTTGENAYIKLQELSGKPGPNAMPLRDVIAKVMASPAYQRAPDGSIETPLTRPWMLARVVSKYRTAAAKRIQQDANVREGLLKAQRKVKDHFAHLKAEPTDEQRGGLQAVLEAFGAGD
ncbi:hypothetical protein FY134_10170 [Agrobacterium fabrum]|uniref:hypothetical protein n=1 Tax=Agrobacterium fabrum TaxID=1176649 RepID=UPI000DCF7F47|nr:hypothetical protein [Agrobacterium fabrum]UXT57992.1 hypothetical protein FY134_10170 [Agrobacterium fabrum]